MTWYGVKLCIGTWNQSIGELPWMPVGATYAPVPLGGFVTLLFVLEHMVFGSQHRRTVVTFDHEAAESGGAPDMDAFILLGSFIASCSSACRWPTRWAWPR
jgi:TRAP-type C4-dicarboxylate transport system permease small subunit